MAKYCFVIICILVFVMHHQPIAYAVEYVLPYPSFMPGNKLYKISRFIDVAKKYWHWGNIASVHYQLGLSDKYLVEAKVLFEYKQFVLAIDAIERSNTSWSTITSYVNAAQKEKKEVPVLLETTEAARRKHIEILANIKQETPKTFEWIAEKSDPMRIPIENILDEAIVIRGKP